MKAIVLAGGQGTRLYPLTQALSKQLLPVYDKPMVYYPLSVLMLAGIREIALISTPDDLPLFRSLLGNGDRFGIKLTYLEQPKPEGIAQALIIAEEFLNGEPCALVLGDNLFFGQAFTSSLREASRMTKGAKVFAHRVSDPERFAVVSFDKDFRATSIEEKPALPKSEWAVTGLYFYDHRAPEMAKEIKKSARGELEITALNQMYLEEGSLSVERLGRGFAWLDTGTHDSLLLASQFVQTVEQQQGLKIACLEEIGYANSWINIDALKEAAEKYGKNAYGKAIQEIIDAAETVKCD